MSLDYKPLIECPYCKYERGFEHEFEYATTAEPQVETCEGCEKPFVILWTAICRATVRAVEGYDRKKRSVK